MTKHLNSARELALDILIRVEKEQSYSNLLLNSVLQQTDLTLPEKSLVTEIVYGTITWKKRLDHVLNQYCRRIDKLDDWVLILLRLSLYQLLFLDRIPDYAVVNEAVNIAKKRGHKGIVGFVNGVLRGYLRNPEKAKIPTKLDPVKRISIEYSHPEWLVQRWIEIYGEQTTELICNANNQPEKISIRVNRLKCSPKDLKERLAEEGIETEDPAIYPYALQLSSKGNPTSLNSYHEGFFSIQDESSMIVAHLLDPKPGMHVLDACAAPGGKTTHIAELMGNKGKILANDFHEHKERFIQEQAKRLGISIIQTMSSDALELGHKDIGTFDRILIDAPCTGFGVIRKKQDIKWNKQLSDVKAISYLQYQLLTNVSRLLKPGGKLIYSTCTIEPEENERLIQRFTQANPQFKVDGTIVEDIPSEQLKNCIIHPGMIQILPHYFGTDGFFIARIVHI